MSKRLRASMRAANKGRNLRPRASQHPPAHDDLAMPSQPPTAAVHIQTSSAAMVTRSLLPIGSNLLVPHSCRAGAPAAGWWRRPVRTHSDDLDMIRYVMRQFSLVGGMVPLRPDAWRPRVG